MLFFAIAFLRYIHSQPLFRKILIVLAIRWSSVFLWLLHLFILKIKISSDFTDKKSGFNQNWIGWWQNRHVLRQFVPTRLVQCGNWNFRASVLSAREEQLPHFYFHVLSDWLLVESYPLPSKSKWNWIGILFHEHKAK